MKREFKKWFDQQGLNLWGLDSDYSHPIYTTYRQKKFSRDECKRLGVKLDDYWWTATHSAYRAFCAGYEVHKNGKN